MVINTPSYGGGSDLWDQAGGAPLPSRDHLRTAADLPASMSDRTLEVVGVTDVVHLALSLGGVSNGVRICQGKTVSVKAAGPGVPLQVDGEPFNVEGANGAVLKGREWLPLTPAGSSEACEPFDVTIEHDGQALMLARGSGGGASAYAAIEERLGEEGLATKQRDALFASLGQD